MSRNCLGQQRNRSPHVSEPDTPPAYAPGGELQLLAGDGPQIKTSLARTPGRPRPRWKVQVVRIDPQKYPKFLRDPDHPFALMAVDTRVREIDSFCARLWARTQKEKASPTDEIRQAAA